jgi:methyl-accepting chemotaxis protein
MSFIQNLRIGTKLAITSALGILLVGCMIYFQMTGNAEVRVTQEAAARQERIALHASEIKSWVRNIRISTRDILVGRTASDTQQSLGSLAVNQTGTLKRISELENMAQLPETKQRAAKLATLVAAYVKAGEQFVAPQNEINMLQAKASLGEALPDSAARISRLINDIDRTRKSMGPVSADIEELIAAIVGGAEKASEQSIAAAAATLMATERASMAIGVATALLLILTAVFSILTIARPTRALSNAMLELAGGNFSVVLPGLGRKDEIGEVAGAVEKFKHNAERRARDEAEAKIEQDHLAAAERKAEMQKLADSFERAVGEIVHTVSSASSELEASASTLTTTSARSQERTKAVAAASEQATSNVQSVASATEEMSSSTAEIGRQVHESARIAGEAVHQAQKTNDRVGELAKAASRIGDVVELINTIAGQTNLLALNATIEAARAGDAGRGFAVVASEVKALAEQTAKATGEIGQQITGIQAATQESVGAIKEIGETIAKMSEIASTIASAVEEQGAATQEISRNVQQAAQGTQQVSVNIIDVKRGASEAGSASSEVLTAAESLSRDSNRLKLEVGRFLDTVREA